MKILFKLGNFEVKYLCGNFKSYQTNKKQSSIFNFQIRKRKEEDLEKTK